MGTSGPYRPLTGKERDTLQLNGCRCDQWEKIQVLDEFDPNRLSSVTFSGEVRLGYFNKKFTDAAGVITYAGIRNAAIHNCDIGNNVIISNIGNCIANYIIEDGAVIVDCHRVSVEGETCFGNGTTVSVMNEAGGRTVRIWDRLSAHDAYITALYRHKREALDAIEKLNIDYCESIKSTKGFIGTEARLLNCGTINNVRIGSFAVVEGASRLLEGSINSNPEAPVYIGAASIMEHFIVCSGTRVDESALIENCFIGEGCSIRDHFAAKNSLFFANCEGFLGEACSVFAGPYTVTHHKSTLLLAGIFSFMNAGSGSNQSNHMYKLGPLHQGILERGCKTTSESYILWPAKVGPFTIIKGEHLSNPDSSSFPFSYLIGESGVSTLVPGVNMKNIGTYRDSIKWPQRDRRKGRGKIDCISFGLYTPYTIGKMVEGRDILVGLKEQNGDNASLYRYNGMKINSASLIRGIALYNMGIDIFIGETIMKRIVNCSFSDGNSLKELLKPSSDMGLGKWVDLAGLYSPKAVIDKLLCDIESGKINKLIDLGDSFQHIWEGYDQWEWNWTCDLIGRVSGKNAELLNTVDIVSIIRRYMSNMVELNKLIIDDAKKEFSGATATGFGMDGEEKEKGADFEEVRGSMETNPFIAEINGIFQSKIILGDRLISMLEKVKQ